MAQRRVEVDRPRDAAWEACRAALAEMGTVEEESRSTGTLVGKARYGTNPVRVRLSVLSAPAGGSVVEIQARGQDIFGVASRKVMDRLVSAL